MAIMQDKQINYTKPKPSSNRKSLLLPGHCPEFESFSLRAWGRVKFSKKKKRERERKQIKRRKEKVEIHKQS